MIATNDRFIDMYEVRQKNAQEGFHWFEPDTMRFFRSRVGDTLYKGRYFVSSEQGPNMPRRWTVRVALPDGRIRDVGGFQRFSSWRNAHRYIEGVLQ